MRAHTHTHLEAVKSDKKSREGDERPHSAKENENKRMSC